MALARKVVAAGAVAVEVTLHRLDMVFTGPTRAVDVLIHALRRGGRQGGDDKAWIVASRHHFRLEDDPPGLGPGGGTIGKRGIETAAVGRARVMGLREGGPLLVQPPRLLQDGCGVAQQDRYCRPGRRRNRSRCRWASTSITSGVAKWLSPRTRICVRGQWRRRKARSRTKIIAFSAPVGRVPGRRQAVTNAPESPSKINRGK